MELVVAGKGSVVLSLGVVPGLLIQHIGLQNRKNTSERLELKKYNKFLRRVTVSATQLDLELAQVWKRMP